MISNVRLPFPPASALEAAIRTMAALQRFQFAEVGRRNLEKELADLIRRSQAERAERDRRRDLVPYDEVLREFGVEIADREARPPLHHRRHVDAAVQRLLDSVGYVSDTGRAA